MNGEGKFDSQPVRNLASVVEVLRWRAEHEPAREAYTFLVDGDTETVQVTYEELDRRARCVAAALQKSNPPESRVVLVYPPGLDYIAAFFGCLYAGMVAVPVYPPKRNASAGQFLPVVTDCQASVVLTSEEMLAGVHREILVACKSRSVSWIAVENGCGGGQGQWQQPALDADSLAYLQYTSGSTGTPKGVIVTHRMLMHNSAAIYKRMGHTENSRGVIWLPPYHDMGLVGGVIQPLYGGFPATLMSPAKFVQRPFLWLKAISRFRATSSGGPDFGYDLCVRRIPLDLQKELDLSSWRVACNGAEPVRAETMRRFTEAFGDCGFRGQAFYPCYGLAEATVMVSGALEARGPVIGTFSGNALEQNRVEELPPTAQGSRAIVGCGQTLCDQRIVIVDPESLCPCPPDRAGEIWVSGPSVSPGYWNERQRNSSIFNAFLADSKEGPFLRTGDIGFLRDGELFIVGRLKDLIIVRGRNLHPEDIEASVHRSHPALESGSGAAFSVEAAGEERLVIVHEVASPRRSIDLDEVIASIRRTVANEYELQARSVVLVKPRAIPRTGSGKIRRSACRESFLNGRLRIVAIKTQDPRQDGGEASGEVGAKESHVAAPEVRAVAEVKEWLLGCLSGRLNLDREALDVTRPLAEYGLDSMAALEIAGKLEEWVGLPLSPTLVYEYPTIELLANHLGRNSAKPKGKRSAAASSGVLGEPIAIVGMGCRFPGSKDARAFWQLLRNGMDAVREVPEDRWNLQAYYDPDPSIAGKMCTRWGGFIDQVDQFDAAFFKISPREAACMDPQQRLLLEVAWEALEDAGQVPEQMMGTATGVFVGISTNDYGHIHFRDPASIDAYSGTGNALSISANRISYVFGLSGPSLAVDTACSSSLVAVHLACRSLWAGECASALAGGVNLILSPMTSINFTKAGVMASDGRCKTFDERANGYVRGEGAGVVVLKPLSRAMADGDRVYALIRSTAINQDGRTNGLMAPNPHAQEALLREAYRLAGISPSQVGYIEAHGTGTLLGDTMEAKAIGAVLSDSPRERPCSLGSVKTNVGHLEAAAGIAGLIKVALLLVHREIPASLNFRSPNPNIPWDTLPLRVQESLSPWPGTSPAIAGVSSFGFGGTNAHIVVEEAPPTFSTQDVGDTPDAHQAHILTLSSPRPESLMLLAREYKEFLASPALSTAPLRDICYSASVHRGHQERRLAVVGRSRPEMVSGLESFLREEFQNNVRFGKTQDGKLAFVFSGQGSQWLGMGRDLMETEPVFASALRQCEEAMSAHLDWSLMEVWTRGITEDLHIDVIQPVLFATQVALAALWRSWGIVPDAVVGHSMGEVAAAYVAGSLSLTDAAAVVCTRSRLLKRLSGCGAMAVVDLSLAEAEGMLAGHKDHLSVAASNSPGSTVLSGETELIEKVVNQLSERGVDAFRVKVDVASHSAQMDSLRLELLQELHALKPRTPVLLFYSTVKGMTGAGGHLDNEYWWRNLREPVLFWPAIERLLGDGYGMFLEISPHPVLAGAVQQGLTHHEHPGLVFPSLRRDQDGRTVMLNALGSLYASGRAIEWGGLFPEKGQFVELPVRPWAREKCSLSKGASGGIDTADETVTAGGHPLLGRCLQMAGTPEVHVWETELSQRRLKFLEDHKVHGMVLLPGTAFLEMALSAANQVFGKPHGLKDVEFRRGLFFAQGMAPRIQVVLAFSSGESRFEIHSRSDARGPWTLHATGTVLHGSSSGWGKEPDCTSVQEIIARCPSQVSAADYYRILESRGYQYGPRFQGVEQLWQGAGEALGSVGIPGSLAPEVEPYLICPAFLDACLQVLGAAAPDGLWNDEHESLFLPVHIDQVRVWRYPAGRVWSHGLFRTTSEGSVGAITGDVRLMDDTGRPQVEVLGLRLAELEASSHNLSARNLEDCLYAVQWKPAVEETESALELPRETVLQKCVIFRDQQGVGESLARKLTREGISTVLVSAGEAYEHVDESTVRIRTNHPEDMQKLLLEALASGLYCAIIYLWGLDLPSLGQTEFCKIEDVATSGCIGVLGIIQELARIKPHPSARLWLVTRGAQCVADEGDSPALAQSPLWGFGRALAQEHAEFWGGLIDLDPAATPAESVEPLWQSLRGAGGEDQVAYRQSYRYVARLVRKNRDAVPGRTLPLRRDGSYLITGGLGSLGLRVASWMVDQGARRLILMGRTQLPSRSTWQTVDAGSPMGQKILAIHSLEASGASIHLACTDVADEAQLRRFLDGYRREGWPPIRGVVHTAGIVELKTLSESDGASVKAVFRPKVTGGWLLHLLLEDDPIEFFVLFSSATSLLGSPRLASYAAANAFLDSLAHYRKSQGKPALSINWAFWGEVGMAVRYLRDGHLLLQGVDSFAPEAALSLMGRLLAASGLQQAGVIPVDWGQWRKLYPTFSRAKILADLMTDTMGPQTAGGSEPLTREILFAAEPAEREQLLQERLVGHLAGILGIQSKLDVHQRLNHLGLDSLMAVELKNRTARELGVVIPMVNLLQGPTVAQLTIQVLDLLSGNGNTGPSETATVTLDTRAKANGALFSWDSKAIEEQIEQLSDAEVEILLNQELERGQGQI